MPRKKDNTRWLSIECKVCKTVFDCRVSRPRTYCSKKCSTNDIDLNTIRINKTKQTCIEKYGGHPMTTEKTKDALKKSLLEKYGVDHYSKHNDYNKKVKSTKLLKYGNEKYTNVDKIKSTLLEKYGVDNSQKIKSVKEKTSNTKKENHYEFLKNHFDGSNLIWLCEQKDYVGYHFSNVYNFKCKVCEKNFESTVYNLNNVFCDYCHPEKVTTVENEIYQFLIEILKKEEIINRNDRTVLNGKELDFYVPSKNFAIEINGLYWHSENAGGINKNYHLNKTKSCMTYGIHLIHIFENEWINKKEIVKSIIRNFTNCNNDLIKINGRECEIKEIDEPLKNAFLNENHLQGEDKSTVKIGLFHDNELVSVMTFRKSSRFDKTSEWELVRFCNKLNTLINGGASKLFSYFIKNYNPKNIVSYSDRRYFSGKIYEKLGFSFVDFTPVNYYYIINKYKDLRHRMSFQKHKLSKLLKVYDPNLSEWENMKNNGYDRIWDCGNSKYFISFTH
jgi:hypothetical protein